MGLYATIAAAWKYRKAISQVLAAVKQFRAEVHEQGAARLSPEQGTRNRRQIELLVADYSDGKDNGILEALIGALGLKDDACEYLCALLKSSKVDLMLHGSAAQRADARRQIMDGVRAADEDGPDGE